MKRPSEPFLLATVPIGGEPLLVRALTECGARARIRAPGVVQWRGDRGAVDRVLEECRCAARLRLRIGAGTPDECEVALAEFPWEEWSPLEPEDALLVREPEKAKSALYLDLEALRSGAEHPNTGVPASLLALVLRAVNVGGEGNIRVHPGGPSGGPEPALVVTVFAAVPKPDELAALTTRFREHRLARHAVLSPVTDLDDRLVRTAAKRWSFEDGDASWILHLFEPAEKTSEPKVESRVFRGRPLDLAKSAAPSGPEGDETRFEEILASNAWLRRRWPQQQQLDCYRLYDRDLPSIPWVVDRYGDALHITIYSAERGQFVDGGKSQESRLVRAAGEALAIDPSHVFIKHKDKLAPGKQHEVQARIRQTRIVTEGGLRFLVNLSDYVDTGLFLDHRLTRGRVREEARGKRFLNLFGYTGSFTVAAAAGGAVATTTVDTSAVYLDWAGENLRLGGFEGDAHRLVRSDAIEFLRGHPVEESYDLVVVDPPTRSNRHGSKQVWDVQRDHGPLLELLLPLVAPGGAMIFSTNYRRFKPTTTPPPGWTIEETTPGSIPPDFRDRKIHRAWRWVRSG